MSQVGDRANRTLEVLQTMMRGEAINGATYSSILLASSEPRISDKYDRAIESTVKHVTIYWPGGSPAHGYDLETASTTRISDEAIPAEKARIRSAILSASIGETALASVPGELRHQWAVTGTDIVGGPAIEKAKAVSAAFALPLAACAISDVTNREPGMEQMHFYYPDLLHPEPVLQEFRTVVQDIFDT